MSEIDDQAWQLGELDVLAVVREQNAKYEACYLADDVAGLMTLYTKNAVIIPPDGVNAIGRDAIADYLGPVLAAVGALKLETVDAKRLSERSIIEHTKMTVYDPDGELLVTGKTMVLWKHEDGEWRMDWDTWNSGAW